jgi:hypothetical protein
MQAALAELSSCGCPGRARRQCQLCKPSVQIFVACSEACLERHRQSAHAGQAVPDARMLMAAANQKRAKAWHLYGEHRRRVTALLRSLQRERGLCVLGAGNCDDLELAELARAFGTAHLVDLDAAALAGGIGRLPEAVRERVVPHGDLDLAFYADALDWEREVPALATLLPRASRTADALVRAIGAGSFDVVLSSCVLTQLWVPLKRTLVLSSAEWQRIFVLMSLTHLLTMAKLVRPGGSAALVTEVTAGAAQEPNLGMLLMLLREHPELSQLVGDLRLIEPWIWTLDGAKASAHAVVFRRTS